MSKTIFESTIHWKNNACINPKYVERWAYVEGFKRAGEILADKVIETHEDQDILVFPILFNYRHYIELAIKDILIGFQGLLDEPFKDRQFHGHDLKKLWKMARPKIIVHFPKSDPSLLTVIDEMIETLHEIDPNGESFRYNEKELGITHIGIDTVRLKMDEVSSLFYGISASVDNDLSCKQEMKRKTY